MLSITFKRVFRSGLQNFFRNGFVSLSSVIVMTITLSVIVSTILASGFFNYALGYVKEKVDVNVYFITTASEPDILSIQSSLLALPEVAEVQYISREQALTDFTERHKSDQLILSALDELGENPLGATLNIRAKDPSQYAGIAAFLEGGTNTTLLFKNGASIIDKVNYSDNKLAIDRLNSLIRSANRIGAILATVFIVISILITFNTIRLIIFMAKDEISVMRLVGASNKYVKGPFVISGILTGVISAAIVIILFAILTLWASKYYEIYLAGFNIFSYYFQNFFLILLTSFGSGIVLGSLASYLATQKYLKD